MEANAIGISRDEGSDRHAKLFEMLLEAIPSSVLLIDDQLRVVAVNRNFLENYFDHCTQILLKIILGWPHYLICGPSKTDVVLFAH